MLSHTLLVLAQKRVWDTSFSIILFFHQYQYVIEFSIYSLAFKVQQGMYFVFHESSFSIAHTIRNVLQVSLKTLALHFLLKREKFKVFLYCKMFMLNRHFHCQLCAKKNLERWFSTFHTPFMFGNDKSTGLGLPCSLSFPLVMLKLS